MQEEGGTDLGTIEIIVTVCPTAVLLERGSDQLGL